MTNSPAKAKRRLFSAKQTPPALETHPKKSIWKRILKDRYLLLLFLPCLIYYILFKYVPMWGVLISFKDFKPFIGFWGSEWVGLKHYIDFFNNPDAWRIIRNTLLLGVYTLLWCFPLPIVFALALNELTRPKFKKFVQTVSYMPHFLSAVVVCGMLNSFLSPVRGIVNIIINMFGGETINFLSTASWFRPIYVASEVWQTLGWGAIVYLAAITNVDPQYYEAAKLDGASRLRQIWSITLPCIAPTVATMLILRIGSILEVGLEKVLLLYSPAIYETSDIIATYVYRQGLVSGNMSYATAIGLFSSVINLVLLVSANYFSKKFADTGLF
ncbi:MAG TPA: ABC transporter permease subunit [Candidatus Gemmiger avicola]|uniref:ABC transporter permease subunit n=1 Tax=Candidatus Gemmiger avicola TaxID=2838605 RepID=A0A9D2S4B4_9FIRM|nr:ABC transporter permease subunit [Candidatus Gemmiger avicola]